ncbi:MAG: OmcA/MtrC family decaheme c-type cytochrome, partial [Nitrospiria bacterium]
LDFKIMIHKIHRGENLPSVVGGGEYAIWGFRDTKHDYSKVKLPQDIRNCRTCHDEKDTETPDAGKWLSAPSKEVCGSCHDNINFETGQNHSLENLPVTNADCTICHKQGGFVGAIDRSHAMLEVEEAAKFKFNILNITNTSPGEFPQITFSVTNPANNDVAYNIEGDAPFVQGGGASRVAIDIGWQTSDYNNTGSGRSPASMVSLNPLGGGAANNGNGTFTMTSTTAIPTGMTGSGMVSIEGHPAVDVNGDGTAERIAVKGATTFFAITDATPSARRAVVSIDKCNACHKTLSLHGANRTDNIDQCLGCHNANNTDINRRPTSPSSALDGKKEESIDFKRLIHALHAGADGVGTVVYGFGGRAHDFRAVEFPGNLNKCSQCHINETYYSVGTGVLATTIDTGTNVADPLDDTRITPTTSACSACHNAPLSLEHMKQNGGAFDATQAADGTLTSATAGVVVETCGVCHGKDKLADVKKVHHIE